MAIIEAVPELADGGYWYHVAFETITENGRTETRPVMPAVNAGWCAWYMADDTVVVRSPVPIVGVDTISLSTADKLIAAGEATRPHGRVGGR